MKRNYALTESQKWREHVSRASDGAAWAYDVELRTALETTLPSVSIDDSQSETRPLSISIFSSRDISSRLADGGEPPVARIEHESVLYGWLRSRSKPDSDPALTEPTEEHRLDFDLE